MVIKFFQKLGFDITNRDFYMLIILYKIDFIIIKTYINILLLRSRNYTALEWLKDQLIKKIQIKDLSEAKTIIRWKIIKDIESKTLKINEKEYIWDLLEVEKMTSCYIIIFSIKAESIISIDQACNDRSIDLVIY